MIAFEYVTPRSLELAARFLSQAPERSAVVKAGGIDLLDRLKEDLEQPRSLLNLRPLREALGRIELEPDRGMLAIGALASLAQIGEDPQVRERFPALAAAAGHAATPQIRQVATLGGNLCQKPRCWYYRSRDFHCLKKGGATCYAVAGDNRYHAIFGAGACHIVHPSNLAVPLRALGAQVRIVRAAGERLVRREVSLDDFFRVPANPQHDEHTLEPGEIIEQVRLPLAAGGPRCVYHEVREKQSFDWPLVSCAVNLNDPDHPRVVLGAVAPVPWRLRDVEELLAGRTVDEELISTAATAAVRRAEPMSGNGYKVALVKALVADVLREAAAGGAP